MLDSLASVLPLLIPVLGLLIGLVVVGSIFVVHPLVAAITKLAEAQGTGPERLAGATEPQLEQRLVDVERTLARLLEERQFDHLLRAEDGSAPERSRLEAGPARRDPV